MKMKSDSVKKCLFALNPKVYQRQNSVVQVFCDEGGSPLKHFLYICYVPPSSTYTALVLLS
uniref:Uncharacterized protein n=1 Tax=Anguilla anguilla TaxID=7936 RepID=A0A0E9SRF3_ANGAN